MDPVFLGVTSRVDPLKLLRTKSTVIRRCTHSDLEAMFAIINHAAQAYKGVIPERQIATSVVLANAARSATQPGSAE